MKKVIGIGSALVDILAEIPTNKTLKTLGFESGSMNLIFDDLLPTVEKELFSLETAKACGGSAGNTLVALGNLGVKSAFIGKVNKQDEYGSYYISDLESNNTIPVIRHSDLPTGRAHTFIEKGGERTFGTYLGAASELNPSDVSPADLEAYDLLYVEGYLVFNEQLIRHVIKTAKASGIKVAIDLASFNIVEQFKDLFDELLNDVDIVFANEEEAKAFTGKEPEEALDILAERCELAIVKVGKDGSYIKQGDEKHFVGTSKVDVVDTTGAGDLFAGGFIYGLTQGINLADCARIGTKVAGEVIQIQGAKLSNEKWDEIKTFIQTIG